MKKLSRLVIVLFAVMLLFVLTGCNTPQPTKSEETESNKTKEEDSDKKEYDMPKGELTVGGAASYTGNFHADGTAIAESFTRSGANASVILSGGTANIIGAGDKTMFCGPTGATSLLAAYEGTDDSFPRIYDDVVAMMALDMMANYFIVPADSNIKTISDLKGKTVVTGMISSTSYVCLVDYLEVYGLKPEDLNIRMASMGEANDMIADKLVDAYFMNTGIPNASIMELCTSVDVKILPIEKKYLDDILARSEAYQPCTLPAGTYKGQNEDILMSGAKTLIVVNSETPDGEVKWALESIIENWGYITKACTWLSGLSFEDLSDSGTMPMHKAAIEFYDELLSK